MVTGTDIRRARRALDWTQAHLADRLGVSRATVGKWETGRATPRNDAVYQLLNLTPTQPHEHQTAPVHDPPLSQASDTLLIAELSRRLDAAAHDTRTAGYSEAPTGHTGVQRTTVRSPRKHAAPRLGEDEQRHAQ